VITTCSERNAEWCKNLGADELINYKEKNWWEVLPKESLDGIFQCVGAPMDFKNAETSGVMKKNSVFATCDRGEGGGLIGGIFSSLARKFTSPIKYYFYLNSPSTLNLSKTQLMMEEQGKERFLANMNEKQVFPFDKALEAFDLSRSKTATGKIVIVIDPDQINQN
jgi:NADPH:quinone reductase-like Zn-dependent oxidoreductase